MLSDPETTNLLHEDLSNDQKKLLTQKSEIESQTKSLLDEDLLPEEEQQMRMTHKSEAKSYTTAKS